MEQTQQSNPEAPKPEIKRVLVLADFACATGFANVSQNLVASLVKSERYQIDVVAINYFGVPSEWQNLYPQVRMFPAQALSGGDVFGRRAFLSMLSTGAYDVVFTLQDTFIIETIGQDIVNLKQKLKAVDKKVFTWIYYYPIDAEPKENWIAKSVKLADIPVAYTQYGKDESVKKVPDLADKIRVIPHGVDTKTFFPLEPKERDAFRKQYLIGKAEGKFLITNVNRNQMRKDIPRTLEIFSLLKRQVPNAFLYLHMKNSDAGGNIDEWARNFNLIPEEDYFTPQGFSEHDGVDPQIVNYIYNMSDVVMTTTLGEGWGLAVTEAMAAKTPVIAPAHTSLNEIVTNRGTLVTAGRRVTDWVFQPNDNERKRPIVDVAEYVDKLASIRNNPSDASKLAETAYEYTTGQLDWNMIGQAWLELFDYATTIPSIEKSLERNDQCWCKSGRKFKKCHLNYVISE